MLVQRLLIGAIVCLAPLLAYMLILIGLNSRRRASLVPGTWDFAGVLLACSGFVLAGGPLILGGLSAAWRWMVVRGRAADWNSIGGQADYRVLLTWLFFFMIVIFGSISLIWRRRKFTIIYNADTDHIWSALEWVFGRLGIVWQRRDNQYILQPPVRQADAWRPGMRESDLDQSREPKNQSPKQQQRLVLNVLPSACNVTMRWSPSDGETRGPIEAEIASLLPNMRAETNPATAWLIGAAIAMFSLIVFSVVFLLITAVRWRMAIGT